MQIEYKTGLIQKWFNNLKEIWLTKNINNVGSLLSEKFEYYENPFESPLTNLNDVKKVWQGVNNQNISLLEINILLEKDNEGIAVYDFVCTYPAGDKRHSRGVYYVKLDSMGKAVEFKQWWNKI